MLCVAEVSSLLPHLTHFSKEHREEARLLQEELASFCKELQHALDEIWAAPKALEGEAVDEFRADSWAARMAETVQRNERRDPRERIQKPEISVSLTSSKSAATADWKVKLLEL